MNVFTRKSEGLRVAKDDLLLVDLKVVGTKVCFSNKTFCRLNILHVAGPADTDVGRLLDPMESLWMQLDEVPRERRRASNGWLDRSQALERIEWAPKMPQLLRQILVELRV